MIELTHLIEAKSYKGQLFPKQASELIEAALNTAKELLSTAETLYNCKRFAHCVSMSILAMEETGKISIIMAMLTGFSEINEGWKQYTRHLSKTEHIDYAIVMQIRNYFSNLSKEQAEAIGNLGFSPDVLEKIKQRAIYSDCLVKKGKGVFFDPSQADWKDLASRMLGEARVIVASPRSYSPAELIIWVKHTKKCHKENRDLATALPGLERELREAGFIKEGWWNQILKMAELSANVSVSTKAPKDHTETVVSE